MAIKFEFYDFYWDRHSKTREKRSLYQVPVLVIYVIQLFVNLHKDFMNEITLPRPDAWHVHLRDEEALKRTVMNVSRRFLMQ